MHDLSLEADLLTLDIKNMLVKWGSNSPARTGMHASSVLQSEKEWCAREQVLHQVFPEQGERAEWNHWDWKKSAIFENGWRLHQRWQDLFKKFGNVVYSPVPQQLDKDGIVAAVFGTMTKQEPELDLTHYDELRNIYFSPDAILMFGGQRYVVEIKGVNHDAFAGTPRDEQGNLVEGLYGSNGKPIKPQEGLTDDLEQACKANETVAKAREQCNLYMHLLSLDFGIILVENKSNQDFKLWVIPYEQERAFPYTNRINEVKGRLLLVKSQGMGKLPARCCQSVSDARAKKCPMRNACFKQEEEEW